MGQSINIILLTLCQFWSLGKKKLQSPSLQSLLGSEDSRAFRSDTVARLVVLQTANHYFSLPLLPNPSFPQLKVSPSSDIKNVLFQGSPFCSLDLSVLLAQAYAQDLGGLVFPHSYFLNLSGHLGVMGLTILGLTFLPCLCLHHYEPNTLSWPKTLFWYYGKARTNFLAHPVFGPFL